VIETTWTPAPRKKASDSPRPTASPSLRGLTRHPVQPREVADCQSIARDPVTPENLAATVWFLLGIDPDTRLRATDGQPLTLSQGTPVRPSCGRGSILGGPYSRGDELRPDPVF